jgi:rhodanese-related sulfurtransferase
VDARSPEEFEKGHIKGAENIAYDVLFPVSEGQISLIKGRDLIIIYDDAPSESEFRPAATFASELKSKGIKNVKYMKERFSDWKKKGFPVE